MTNTTAKRHPRRAPSLLLLVAAAWPTLASADAWQSVPAPAKPLTAVVANGVAVVAVGADGLTMRRPLGGGAWTILPVHEQVSDFERIVVQNGAFLAQTDNAIYRSSDGLAWTRITTLPPLNSAQLLIEGPDALRTHFDGSATVWSRSSDGGTTWTAYTLAGTVTSIFATSTHQLDGGYVAVGPSAFYRSVDGVTWTSSADPGSDVVHDGSAYVKTGYGLRRSVDGVSWTTLAANWSSCWTRLAWNGSVYVAIGCGANINSSNDGVNWTTHATGLRTTLAGLTWTGSEFVAVGSYGAILSSPDGTTWSVESHDSQQWLNQIASDGTVLLAVRNELGTAKASTSPDGTTWTPYTTAFAARPEGLIAHAGDFFERSGVKLFRSADGASWTQALDLGDSIDIAAMASDGTTLVLARRYDTILTWDGAIAVERRTPSSSGAVATAAAWTGTRFLVACAGGIVLRSIDGITWTETLPTGLDASTSLASLASDGSTTLGLDSAGAVWRSLDDGATWTTVAPPTGDWTLLTVAWDGARFLLGAKGALFASADGLTWTTEVTPARSVSLYRGFASHGGETFAADHGANPGLVKRLPGAALDPTAQDLNLSVARNAILSGTLIGTDPGGAQVWFRVRNLTSGSLSFDETTGAFEFAQSSSAAGSYDVTFEYTVNNSRNYSAPATVTIHVGGGGGSGGGGGGGAFGFELLAALGLAWARRRSAARFAR